VNPPAWRKRSLVIKGAKAPFEFNARRRHQQTLTGMTGGELVGTWVNCLNNTRRGAVQIREAQGV